MTVAGIAEEMGVSREAGLEVDVAWRKLSPGGAAVGASPGAGVRVCFSRSIGRLRREIGGGLCLMNITLRCMDGDASRAKRKSLCESRLVPDLPSQLNLNPATRRTRG